MKNLFFLSLMAIACLAGAQEVIDNRTDFRKKLIIGPKVGFNYSNIYDSQGENLTQDGKFGLVAGGFLAIPIGKLFGIQPEVLFSQKGFKAKGSILGGGYNLTRTTSYLDIPILFALKPSEFFTIVAGPQYSYLISQKDVFDNGVTTVEQEQQFKNDDLRKNTLCFTGGFDITIKRVVLGGRIGWDLLNNAPNGNSTTPRYKNVWYQATFGLRIF